MFLYFRKFNMLLLLFFFFSYHVELHADNTVIAPLNFGKIVVTNNTTISSLKIIADGGGCYVSGDILIVETCSPAEIYFYNFPANTQLYFTTTISNTDILSSNASTAQFQLLEVTSKDHLITNENGEVTLNIGGTLTTTGGGGNYLDSSYQGYYRVNVEYY